MLAHPTLDRLNAMGLTGMAKAFDELAANAEAEQLSHAEWLALLLDREWSWRYDRKLGARLRFAKLRHQATPEDVDYRGDRGLDRALFLKLIAGDWIDAHDNLAICGPSGVGKSWLACALGHKACRDDRSVLYQRVPRLFANLALARGDGRYARLQRTLGRVSCSSWMIGVWSLSMTRAGTISSKSSRIAMAAVPPSSPVSFPCRHGTMLSGILPTPTQSWIVIFRGMRALTHFC